MNKRNTQFSFTVETISGETLHLIKLDRRQMGSYLCIASNDVPPAVSKRITLHVNCEYHFSMLSFIFNE